MRDVREEREDVDADRFELRLKNRVRATNWSRTTDRTSDVPRGYRADTTACNSIANSSVIHSTRNNAPRNTARKGGRYRPNVDVLARSRLDASLAVR